MTGVDHRAPGLAVAALTDDDAYVELIADGQHVHPALWPIITRTKPADRLLLVSDALSLAGMGDGRATLGGVEVEVRGGRCTIDGSDTLAGSVIALDTAVRNLVAQGTPARTGPSPRRPRTPRRCWGPATAGGSRSGAGRTWSSWTKTCGVRRVTRGAGWIDGAGTTVDGA